MPPARNLIGQILGDRTSDAPHFSRLNYSHALVDIFHFLGRVVHAPIALGTPYIQKEDNPGSECRKLWGQAQPRVTFT